MNDIHLISKLRMVWDMTIIERTTFSLLSLILFCLGCPEQEVELVA